MRSRVEFAATGGGFGGFGAASSGAAATGGFGGFGAASSGAASTGGFGGFGASKAATGGGFGGFGGFGAASSGTAATGGARGAPMPWLPRILALSSYHASLCVLREQPALRFLGAKQQELPRHQPSVRAFFSVTSLPCGGTRRVNERRSEHRLTGQPAPAWSVVVEQVVLVAGL